MTLSVIFNPIGSFLKRHRSIFPPRISFWLFMAGYKLFPQLGCRREEWNFVLKKLPRLSGGTLRIADVGGALSLISHELSARGYEVIIIDQLPPTRSNYLQADIRDIKLRGCFDIVICISVIEHIGLGQYGDARFADAEQITLGKINQILKPGGILFLTTPHLTYGMNTERKYSFKSMGEFLRRYGFMIVHADYISQQIAYICEKIRRDDV